MNYYRCTNSRSVRFDVKFLRFLSGHDNIQEIRTDPLDYHRLSVIHFAHTECSRVFRDYAINYLDSNSQTLLSTLNPTVSVASLLRLYSLKLKEKNISQSKIQGFKGFNRLYIQRNRFETQGCQKGYLKYNGFSFALKFSRPYIYKS